MNFNVKLPVALSAPVEQGQTIGEVTITINDEVYKIVPLYSMEKRTKITYEYILKRILLKFFGGYSVADG